MDKIQARIARIGTAATAFVSSPEPRTVGDVARGRQLLTGNFLIDGEVFEAPDSSIWTVGGASDARVRTQFHDFRWLDDLVAVGGPEAQKRGQLWLDDWISRYGAGTGPGWVPDITGRRLIRWINHALFLLGGGGSSLSSRYFQSLGHQAVFLNRRWPTAASGLPRFEALTGVVYAGMALRGLEGTVGPAVKALTRECEDQIDGQGALQSRNPEDLLEVLTLLTWAADALEARGQGADPAHIRAIARIAPTLRALRHSDGGLTRCHGGGRGLPGQLEQALSRTGVQGTSEATTVMGYNRMQAGRTTVISDAAPPPRGAASATAHASTLAFEVTSGRRPLIVNCGPGHTFGSKWRRAGRATASHSTLSIDGTSSSRLATQSRTAGPFEPLVDVPTRVSVQPYEVPEGLAVLMSHDGYEPTHGLTHARQLHLDADGRSLQGTDTLAAIEPLAKKRCMAALAEAEALGIPFSVRFHIAPDVDAELDMGGQAVSLRAKNGEVWVFRAPGSEVRLEPSVYLEKGRLKPRATKQIVLSGRVMDYATEVSWILAKTQDTPTVVRDLGDDERLDIV